MKIKIPKKKNNLQIIKFFKEKNLFSLLKESKGEKLSINSLTSKRPFVPELNDLYRLYQFIKLNKRTTILEFGSGWSSLIFFIALSELKKENINNIKNLRRNNAFEIFILENEKKYLDITKKRNNSFIKNNSFKIKSKIHYKFSNAVMTTINNRICTKYKKLPLCSPDFIYLDGPNQFKVKKDINGISTRHKDMLPMVSDIIRFEYFLTPGTIIVCDGRSANAKFMKDHFKRKWTYKHDRLNDQHIFLLADPVLGKINQNQIDFYNS